MRRMKGISLMEVVAALAIVFLLVGVAMPALAAAVARVRIGHTRMALVDSFLVANRLAVAAGSATVMCPAPAQGGCSGRPDWSRGWLVFADVDGDRAFSARDTLIQRRPALGGGIRLHSTQGRTRIVFQPDGDIAGTNLTFTLCSVHADQAGTVVLSNAGRFHLGQASTAQTRGCQDG